MKQNYVTLRNTKVDPKVVPKYVWHLVAAHLAAEDVVRLSGVCSALWSVFGQDEGFWRRRCRADFAEEACSCWTETTPAASTETICVCAAP